MMLDTLGNVGGIFEIMFFVFGIFYCCYKDYARSKYLQRIVHKRSTHEYQNILGTKSQKLMSEKMEELIEEHQDADKLTTSLLHLNVIEQAMMKPCHRVLSPLFSIVEKVEKEKRLEKAQNNPL